MLERQNFLKTELSFGCQLQAAHEGCEGSLVIGLERGLRIIGFRRHVCVEAAEGSHCLIVFGTSSGP